MNTTRRNSFSALALAAFFTVAMLAGVNGLAGGRTGAAAPHLAQAAAVQPA